MELFNYAGQTGYRTVKKKKKKKGVNISEDSLTDWLVSNFQ